MSFCTPCHNDAMAGKHKAQTECEGGPDCPLGIPKHPKARKEGKEAVFPLGCSLCRSERLERIADNDKSTSGIKLERRDSMNKRFGHVHGHDIERELRINRRGNAPAGHP